MSYKAALVFTCDSPDGCMAHASVAAFFPVPARIILREALGWSASEAGDLCPEHRHQTPVKPVKP